MALLNKVSIQNFKGFRKEKSFDFSDSTYLIGKNNAGKTAILSAICCFFESKEYEMSMLNKTEFIGKGKGSNKTVISVEFDLEKIIKPKVFKQKLIYAHGKLLKIGKIYTYKEKSGEIEVKYKVGNEPEREFQELELNIRKLLLGISVSYIHPKDAADSLNEAKTKLKDRMISNWGRRGSSEITVGLKKLREDWKELRKSANSYLSSALTSNLQVIWQDSDVKVDLPQDVTEIIAVSEIMFRGGQKLPEISLTSQGAGAQSVILYIAHFLLDSDRSIHTGFYYKVWLLEEPETFIHADMISKLGRLLSSDSWLENIQMVISTHSPLILAASRQNEDRIIWHLLEDFESRCPKIVQQWTTHEIESIGRLMGDSNFSAYFDASSRDHLFFIEDSREETCEVLRKAGLPVKKGLNGITQVVNYIHALADMTDAVLGRVYFLVDGDNGFSQIKSYLDLDSVKTVNDFKKYLLGGRIKSNNAIQVICLPEGYAIENLFDEYDTFLDIQLKRIVIEQEGKLSLKNIPPELLGLGNSIRNHVSKCASMEELKAEVMSNSRKQEDVKRIFWNEVRKNSYRPKSGYIDTINKLLKEEL